MVQHEKEQLQEKREIEGTRTVHNLCCFPRPVTTMLEIASSTALGLFSTTYLLVLQQSTTLRTIL